MLNLLLKLHGVTVVYNAEQKTECTRPASGTIADLLNKEQGVAVPQNGITKVLRSLCCHTKQLHKCATQGKRHSITEVEYKKIIITIKIKNPAWKQSRALCFYKYLFTRILWKWYRIWLLGLIRRGKWCSVAASCVKILYHF
jgi:hypothetical protein